MGIELDDAASCVPGAPLDASHIDMAGPDRVAASAFEVDALLAASARYAVAATDRVGELRGVPVPERSIDLEHLLAYCTTHVEIDGETVPAWADLSGVYPTVDGGHLQIHCNFAHHAEGVVQRLGCAHDRASVASAIAERDAVELETELVADGMIGAAIRTLDEWNAHPHAEAARDLPLITVEQIGDADPLDDPAPALREPLGGLRVLDCSRVLAGPVAGQMAALFGADVLRLGADHLESVPVGVISTGFGKRNASLDLRAPGSDAAMDALLARSDVWIDAFRPDGLAGLGHTVERAADQRPGIVAVQISAFDWTGPWAGRRGFDSIVQSTTGVRWAGGANAVDAADTPLGSGPTGLPIQALDYATGFLAAGVAAQLVAHQRRVGGSWLARVSLLRTRDWLVHGGGPYRYQPSPVGVDARLLDTVDSDFGSLTSVRPFAGRWASPPALLGSSPAQWW